MSARTDARLFGTAGSRRQLPLTELYELSMPLLSEIELVGQRLPDDKSREGNLSSAFANRSVAISSELAALEIPVSGHRDSAADSLLVEPARDAKSDPMPEPDAAPARSLQLLPSALTPQVRELPPPSVPIGPLVVAAVVVAYSPIVCAPACDARNAATRISAAAGSNIFLMLIVSPSDGLLSVNFDNLSVPWQTRQYAAAPPLWTPLGRLRACDSPNRADNLLS